MKEVLIKFEGSEVVYPWPEGTNGDPPAYIDKEDFELRDPKLMVVYEYTFNPDTNRYVLK